MATQLTARGSLEYWQRGDLDWHVPYRRSVQWLAAQAAVGGLAVSPAAVDAAMDPSGLDVRVGYGAYLRADGSPGSYAGTAAYTLPASSTRVLYLDASGALASGAAWPAGAHVRLATVTTDAAKVTAIADERVAACATAPAVASLSADAALGDAHGTVAVDTTGGDVTLTLPDATARPGRELRVIRATGGANDLTIEADGAQTINGAGSVSLASQWDAAVLVSDGSNWLRF